MNEIRFLAVAALRYREVGNWEFDVLRGVREIVLTAHESSMEFEDGRGREMCLVRGQEVLVLEREEEWWELPAEVYGVVKALERVLDEMGGEGKGRSVVKGGFFAGIGKS